MERDTEAMIETRALSADVDLLALHRRAPERFPVLLESVAAGTPRARYDILFIADGSGFRQDADGLTRSLDGNALDSGFLDTLETAWQSLRIAHSDIESNRAHGVDTLPFHGGWALYLGYELAQDIEPALRLPALDTAIVPTALALRCPGALIRDRSQGIVIAIAEDGHAGLLDNVVRELREGIPESGIDAWPAPETIVEDDPQRFLDGVARIHDYLAAGDVFQVKIGRAHV